MLMLKKSLLSVSCALAFGAVALPAVASSFYLVVPIPVAEKVTEPEEPITVSLAGAELPDGQRNKAYSESLQASPAIGESGGVADGVSGGVNC